MAPIRPCANPCLGFNIKEAIRGFQKRVMIDLCRTKRVVDFAGSAIDFSKFA